MSEEIAKLKYWLSLRGNNHAKMAYFLGYESSVTVQQWVSRERIPNNRLEQVMEVIDKDLNGVSRKNFIRTALKKPDLKATKTNKGGS